MHRPHKLTPTDLFALAMLIAILFAGIVNFPELAPSLDAQGVSTTQIYEPFAFENLAISSTAVGFTASTYAPGGGQVSARKAFCTVNTADIRYRVDGGAAPTSSVGHLVDVGVQTPPEFELFGPAIRQFRGIAVGSDATASCTFYR